MENQTSLAEKRQAFIDEYFKKSQVLGSNVRLRINPHNDNGFEVYLWHLDPFLEQEVYFTSQAIIYLSPLFYKTLDEIADKLNLKLVWNNTQTIGRIYLKE